MKIDRRKDKKPRRIILLAHNLRSAGGLSVGRSIVMTLPAIAPDLTFLIVVPDGCGYPEFRNAERVKVCECPKMPLPKRWLWEHLALRRIILSFNPDWIWALGNIPLWRPPCRQSLLFHNPHRITRFRDEKCLSIKARLWAWLLDREFRKGLRWVDRLYCQTETMRKHTHERFNYPLDRIGICSNAFNPLIQIDAPWPDEIKEQSGRFILLCMTRYYPHKNLEVIVEAFSRHRDILQEIVCILPVDASQHKGAAALIDRIRDEGLEKQIYCIGAIPHERLGAFYLAADVMILPTLLESFSGTYLEAMQFEVPILTSDRCFAHEVCGDAALYINPLSTEDVTQGILRLKNDAKLREALVAKGRQRLADYIRTWPEILGNVLEQEGIEHAPLVKHTAKEVIR